MITKHQSYCYADKVVKNEIPAPKYVIKQCKKFLEICDGKSEKYFHFLKTPTKQVRRMMI